MLKFLVVASLAFVEPSHAPAPPCGNHVELETRCDPPIAQPGGWVDVVLVVHTEPGWHVTSPRSKSGPRGSVELAFPDGFERSGSLRVPAGKQLVDPVFGAIEILEGRFELRQRARIRAEQAEGKLSLDGSSTWVVCDPVSCLPPQTLEFSAPLVIAVKGAAGPDPPIGPASFELSPDERATLLAEGLVARVQPELEHARAGDELLVAVDLAYDSARIEGEPEVEIEPSDDWRALGEGWRVRECALDPAFDASGRTFRRLLPLRITAADVPSLVEIPIRVAWKPIGAEASQRRLLARVGIER